MVPYDTYTYAVMIALVVGIAIGLLAERFMMRDSDNELFKTQND